MSVTVFDLDDLCDAWDPWEDLCALAKRYPGFKVTLFAIPGRCSDELLARYRACDWVELGVHGYHHSTMECGVWGYDETRAKLEEMEELGWDKVFKAPGWVANEQVYAALHDAGWKVADHTAHMWASMDLPVDRYTYNLPGQQTQNIHGHTWDVCGNGPSAWREMFEGVDKDAYFAFVSEVTQPLNLEFQYWPVQDEYSSWSHKSPWGKRAAWRMQEFVEREGPESVADFGGNDGSALANGAPDVTERWNVDGDPQRARFAADNYGLNSACVNLEKLPFPDDSFEWGFSSHTLEHVTDLEAAWRETTRCVRKGVWVVVPVESEESFAKNPAHLRRHTHEEWCELLGLEVVERTPDELIGVWRK